MNRRWLVPAFAAALAIVTTLAILSYLQGLRRPAAIVPQVRAESVVFAKTDITQRRPRANVSGPHPEPAQP